jgi:hypothetical protein
MESKNGKCHVKHYILNFITPVPQEEFTHVYTAKHADIAVPSCNMEEHWLPELGPHGFTKLNKYNPVSGERRASYVCALIQVDSTLLSLPC